jgi:CRISPR-associated protein Cas2
MLILVTYDVNTETEGGKARLRKVARQCVNYGVRVQNSVFECNVDGLQARILKEKLAEIINTEKDSIRIYYLNERQKQKIECLGVKRGIEVDRETLIL